MHIVIGIRLLGLFAKKQGVTKKKKYLYILIIDWQLHFWILQ